VCVVMEVMIAMAVVDGGGRGACSGRKDKGRDHAISFKFESRDMLPVGLQ
jgi:hypothetical protein